MLMGPLLRVVTDFDVSVKKEFAFLQPRRENFDAEQTEPVSVVRNPVLPSLAHFPADFESVQSPSHRFD